MESIFEILVPLVIAFAYFLNNVLRKSKDSEEPPPIDQEEWGEEPPDFYPSDEPPRRQPAEGGRIVRSADQPPAFIPIMGPGAQQQATPAGYERQPAGNLSGPSDPDVPPAFPWESSEDFYQAAMQAKLEKIESTRATAEELRQHGSETNKKKSSNTPTRQQSRIPRENIRNTLADPKAARLAFIYSEVFGPPVSQKKSSSVPGLN